MTFTEETCRWAYAKAMRIEDIRQALLQHGRAIFFDDDTFVEDNRYVLSRVEATTNTHHPATLIYCNGVCVEEAAA